MRTGSRHAPRGTACRLSLCVVHRGPAGLQDGPGCATPAVGDPCRTRTCIRCLRGSRPTDGRTGRGCRQAKGAGFEPRDSRTVPDIRSRAPGPPAPPLGRCPCRSDSNGRPLTSDTTPSCAKSRRDDTRGQIQTDEPVFARPVLSNEPTESGTAPCAPPLCGGPESAGQEVKPVPTAPWLRPGAPTSATRRRKPLFGRAAETTRPSAPFVGDLFSCQGAIWATRTKTFMQMNSRWRRESNLIFGRFGGRPASGAPSLRVLSCVRRTPRKSKSRSLAEAARAAMDP